MRGIKQHRARREKYESVSDDLLQASTETSTTASSLQHGPLTLNGLLCCLTLSYTYTSGYHCDVGNGLTDTFYNGLEGYCSRTSWQDLRRRPTAAGHCRAVMRTTWNYQSGIFEFTIHPSGPGSLPVVVDACAGACTCF